MVTCMNECLGHPYEVLATGLVPCPGGCGELVRIHNIRCQVDGKLWQTLDNEDMLGWHLRCLHRQGKAETN
jgi:hypothetical protein